MNGNHRKRIEIKWQRYLPTLLILSGAGAIAVALAADLVSDYPGLGSKQITLIAAGAALLLSGVVLATPRGWRYLSKWHTRVTSNTQPASLLLIAVWFGLLTGWGETLVWLIRKLGGQSLWMRMGPDFLWMIPLANLLFFLIFGLILSLIAWRRPKLILLRTAAHGEHFGEHGLMFHGTSLYLPLLHVPLLISYPPLVPAGQGVQTSVSLRDLPAMIIDLIGVDQSSVFPGNSLRRYWSPASEVTTSSPGALLSEVEYKSDWPSQFPAAIGPMKSLVVDGKHYIKNYGDGREELYDIEQDPTETQDSSGSDEGRKELEQFRAILETIPARSRLSI